jgi:alkylhydroperoxidase/carboxymuconolactone decarboxylase family protein YurZ
MAPAPHAPDHDLAEVRESAEFATLSRLRPDSFTARFEQYAALDPHFAMTWVSYTGGLLGRQRLDLRTMLLVLTGQYTMLRQQQALRDVLTAGATEGAVAPKEMLEAIFQCYVYGGDEVVAEAVETFVAVMREHGLLAEVQSQGLPVDASTRGRDLEQERRGWSAEDAADPRLEHLISRYGWTGLSNGMRLRPGQHLNLVSQFDALDPEWCQIWIDITFDRMYGRGVLDDRARILCIVGDCLAAGDTYQAPRHMHGALRAGATPRDVLEVVLQSCHVIGHPLLMGIAINDAIRVIDEAGRIRELVDDDDQVDLVRRVVRARIAGRATTADMTHAEVKA